MSKLELPSVGDRGDRPLGFNLKCARCMLMGCRPDQRGVVHLAQFDPSEVDTSPLDAVTIWHGAALCEKDARWTVEDYLKELRERRKLGEPPSYPSWEVFG